MSKRLDDMRRSPQSDWRIADVEFVCREHGLTCQAPRGGGSHYKVSHPDLAEILTIPSRRPIKAVYLKKLVALIDALGNSDGST
jgi:hypothetical protein